MKSYLDLLETILNKGVEKTPTRVESFKTVQNTIGVPNMHWSHNGDAGFPLVTTRKINWKAGFAELRGFLEGCDNTKEFEELGCNYWKPWADKATGNLGPIYGVQWNRHGQLSHVLKSLREAPYDRRMVVSAWRPDEHDLMALPPCHTSWNVCVYGDYLHLAWMQRSCDMPIGVPYDIAIYSLLQHLLATWGGFKVGNLSGFLVDCHIYENQIAGVREQIARTPLPLPKIKVWFKDPDVFTSWEVCLTDYNYHKKPVDLGKVEV